MTEIAFVLLPYSAGFPKKGTMNHAVSSSLLMRNLLVALLYSPLSNSTESIAALPHPAVGQVLCVRTAAHLVLSS